MVKYFWREDKQIFYILTGLGWCFEAKKDIAVTFKLFYAVGRDLTLFLFIFLISNKEKNNIGFTLRHHLIVPSGQVIERLQSSYIVRQEYAMGTSIEYFGYTLEALLAGRVPYLKLEHLLLQLDEECSELHSHRHLVISHKLVVGQPVK